MWCRLHTRMLGAALLLLIFAASNVWGQFPIGMGFRGLGAGMVAPGVAGGNAGFGYGGYPYPNLFMPFPGGYGYGGYDPIVASVPSRAYFTYGNTSYTTESPSPIPVYAPRTPFVPLPPPLPLTALLKVQVPSDAEVWLDGQKMRSSGAIRHYRTPPLNPTKEYAYEVRSRWRIDEKPVEDVRHIAIRAGATILIDFTHLDANVPRLSSPTPPPPPPPKAPADPANPAPG